jgi:hypothetical protein
MLSTGDQALVRNAEDYDTFCISAVYADPLIPALFGDSEGSRRIGGTTALVHGREHEAPTILDLLVSRLSGA